MGNREPVEVGTCSRMVSLVEMMEDTCVPKEEGVVSCSHMFSLVEVVGTCIHKAS